MNDSTAFPTPDPSSGGYESAQASSGATDSQSGSRTGAQPFAFCQQCGRGLTQDSARVVGQSVYCEPCLQARLAGAPGQAPPPGSAYPGGYAPDPYAPAWVPEAPGAPNPGLATLLGFIPGVGAMYNEQYAKGIVHLIVFVLLVTVTDSFGIFGLFIAGWEFYMAIDANHTARARRDGLPLPNPFGLNDIGERLGFGKAWPGNPNVASAAQQAARSAASQASQAMRDAAAYAAQASGRPVSPPPYTAVDPYSQAQPQGQSQSQDRWSANHPPVWTETYTGPSAPPPGSYAAEPIPPAPAPINRFPAGAVWLIGLGALFLLPTTVLFNSIHPHFVFGLILIGLGVWISARRMSESGLGWQNDGTATYRYRAFRALRVSIWLVAIGLWLMLDAFHWMHLHHTWPLLLIFAGVMALLERLFLNDSQAEGSPAPDAGLHGDWSAATDTTGPSATSENTKGGI